MTNLYLPQPAKISRIVQETTSATQDIKTYRLALSVPLAYAPGQFVEAGLPGVGEAPFGFSSAMGDGSSLELTIKRTGAVTEAIHQLNEGDTLWLRGPFGKPFPYEQWQGENLLFVAGGLGLAPLRPLIDTVFAPAARSRYGKIQLLLAARTPEAFVFAYEYDKWAAMPQTALYRTIDRPAADWQGWTGFPHLLLPRLQQDTSHTVAVLCGPPSMIKALSGALLEQGLPPQKIFTTLEMRMSCGLGKCGRCNIGKSYVCVDGPVFSLAQLQNMPQEY